MKIELTKEFKKLISENDELTKADFIEFIFNEENKYYLDLLETFYNDMLDKFLILKTMLPSWKKVMEKATDNFISEIKVN